MISNAIERALGKGLRFLLSRQAEGGFWADWRLPPGESKIWTTAYVGRRLASLSDGAARLALRRAAFWLRAHEFPEGGWGDREELGADSDSTALAILFLCAQRFGVPDGSYRRLLAFQSADGGFAAFLPPHGFGAWTRPHPEATATAVAALMTRYAPCEPRVARGIEWLRPNSARDGLSNSYWWDSRLYSIEANLAAFRRAGVRIDAPGIVEGLRALPARNPFEQSLSILSDAHMGCVNDAAISALLSAQEADGGWPSSALLRLTDRGCEEPWSCDEAGPLFLDHNRVLTTATALAALARVRIGIAPPTAPTSAERPRPEPTGQTRSRRTTVRRRR